MRRALLSFGATTFVVLAAFAGVGGANLAVDLTEERSASLSATTLDVLDRVDHRLRLTAFFPREAAGRVEASTMLSRYRDANRRITFRVLDPNVVPGEAERLGIEEIGNTAVEDLSSDDVEVAQFAIEIDLTSAIARVLRGDAGTVCVTTGHGERAIDDDDPDAMGRAGALLRAHGYTIRTVDLLAKPDVPASCDAVLASAPDTTFDGRARDALRAYLDASGKLFVLADPDAAGDLTKVTRRWGISFVDGVVIEGDDGSHMPDDLTAPIVSRYAGGNAVVRGLGPTFFPRVMGVSGEAGDDDGLTVTELASTSEVSYLDRTSLGDFDEGADREGPIAIGASADDSEVRSPGRADARIARTRILAWGDVDFATNAFIDDGDNGTLFLQGVDWLTQPEDLVTAVPTFPKLRELGWTQARSRYVLELQAGVVPAMFVIAGLMVWVVRRSR